MTTVAEKYAVELDALFEDSLAVMDQALNDPLAEPKDKAPFVKMLWDRKLPSLQRVETTSRQEPITVVFQSIQQRIANAQINPQNFFQGQQESHPLPGIQDPMKILNDRAELIVR